MAYRNKVYVAFDGDNDIRYYEMLVAWSKNKKMDFDFNNAHDLNYSNDSSLESSIKAQLRKRFANSKCFVLLIGKHTKYLKKFVKWEIETAIRLDLPIVCVNLNKNKSKDNLAPASLNNQLAIYIPYEEKIIKYALDNWPQSHEKHRKDEDTGSYHY